MKIKNYKAVWLLFAVYLIGLLALHKQVFLYSDDYGYASLSYGHYMGTNGLRYGLSDILKYLKWHYMNWGGRILYFFFEICSLKIGLGFIQYFQALIIWCIGLISFLLVKEEGQSDFHKAALIVFMFGTLGLEVFNRGVLWFSASVSYVWPLLPLFLLVYIRGHFKTPNKATAALGIAAAFLAAFSFEQIAVLTIIYLLSSFVIERIQGQWNKHDWGILAAAILGGALELLAPGNFIRSTHSAYDLFNQLSILGKIRRNFPFLLEKNLGKDNKFFVIALILVGFFIIWYCQDKRKKSRVLLGIDRIAYLFSTSIMVLMWRMDIPIFMGIFCRTVWAALFSYHVIVTLWKLRRFDLTALFLGGLCSEGMMLVSPSIEIRCVVPFDFVLMVIAASAIGGELQKGIDIGKTAVICITGILGIVNMSDLVCGYHDNMMINTIKILINGQEYHTVIDKGFVSTAVPKEVLETGYVEINLLDEASGVLSDSFVWIDEDSIK